MNKQQLTTFGLIAGTAFLLILLALAFNVECPGELMRSIFPVVTALAGAGFAIALPGILKIGGQNISAVGALAVFLLLLKWPPVQLEANSDKCYPELKGIVIFGEKPLAEVTINLVGTNQSTTSDKNGLFRFEARTLPSLDEVQLQLAQDKVQLDSVFTLSGPSPLRIKVPQYCVRCEHQDDKGKIIRQSSKCSAGYQYLQDYVEGYTQAGKEQGLVANCQ